MVHSREKSILRLNRKKREPRILESLADIDSKDLDGVIALGNFDGVHLGHQRLIKGAVNLAKTFDLPSLIITFDPHPRTILKPQKPPQLLLTKNLKRRLLSQLEAGVLFFFPFNENIALSTPQEFVRDILVKKLAVNSVFVGSNFTFGFRGKGNVSLLQSLAAELNFNVHVLPLVRKENTVVSSSNIRYFLKQGNITKAAQLLGYFPLWEGEVVVGERRGYKLGFPTANLDIDPNILLPAEGVYAGKVFLKGEWLKAVINIGKKPTFNGKSSSIPEAHILNFPFKPLYGYHLEMQIFEYLRPERKFISKQKLINQIKKDINKAEKILNNR